VRDATTGKVLLIVSKGMYADNCVAWSPDGKRLATGGDNYVADLLSAETGG
jgi:hypothetical protein